jgi:hypothetical protein
VLTNIADKGQVWCLHPHPSRAWCRLEARGSEVIIDDGARAPARRAGEQRLRLPGAGAEAAAHGQLQHNKTIAWTGRRQAVVCGSTNFSWRGFFVQSNNAMVLRGKSAVKVFLGAFNDYWTHGDVAGFGKTASTTLTGLGFSGIDVRVAFSPHSSTNALLATVADDIGRKTTSNLFYSLAFLYQTPGPILMRSVTNDDKIFVYGISDRSRGIDQQKPDGNVAPVFPASLQTPPGAFKAEPMGGACPHAPQVRRHRLRKADRACVHGVHNFSSTADIKNGKTCWSSATGGLPSRTSWKG